MKKSQFETLIREVIRETIRKVDGKYVVYPEKGGKRLGTHSTKKAAEKQLTAIHLNKENYTDGKGNKNTLEYLNSITKEAPFNPPQYLYHLCAPENIDSILKTGLKPGKPEASLHGGKIKGEEFSGVWLTPIDDVDEIVDTHFLPEEFYNGEILQIDTSGLNKDRFSIGIEYNLMKPPFTKQEYLDKTEEIIYLDAIPPSAISTLQENYADGKVKGKSRPGRVKKAGASCKGSVTDLRAKAKKYSGEKGKMYHWCANMKGGKKK